MPSLVRRLGPLCLFAGVAFTVGCSGGASTPPPFSSGTPTPGPSATPTPGATATPTPGATATPTPGATATPTPGAGFTFGGSTATQTFNAGQATTVNLAAYAGITASIAFGAPTSPSSFSLSFADAVNNGDITPAGFLADNATAGNTPIVYFSVKNSGSGTDSFGTMTPAFMITDTNASFGAFTTCQLDVYGNNGGPTPSWHAPGASGSRSGTAVTVPSINLGAGSSVSFQPGQQIVAISCH